MKKRVFAGIMTVMMTSVCMAGAYDIKDMTPQVKAALTGRKDRFAEIKQLKAQGLLGENNRGYVEILGGGAEAKALAAAENKDRKFIYQTIVDQNGLKASDLATVEMVFADVQRDKAVVGEKIQAPEGAWQVK
jgi:uncharacterized protein YdbL (DUF1318 family)